MKKFKSDDTDKTPANNDLIFGRNAVFEALKSSRRVNKIFIADGSGNIDKINKIIALAKESRVRVEFKARDVIEKLAPQENHQGVIAFCSPVEYADFDEILKTAAQKESGAFFLLLDGLSDPQNLGAIIRTAEAAGVDAVFLPRHRSVPLNATVAKTSAGAVEYVPVALIGNVTQTLEKLKECGFWIGGADMDGKTAYDKADLTGNLVLVIGGEGKGISRLVKEHCDFLVQLPMRGKINSLNASVAAGILIYEAVRQRQTTG